MKKIERYKTLNNDLVNRLNTQEFKFLTFHDGITNTEIVTLEEGDEIKGYATLIHSTNMNHKFYNNLVCEVEMGYEDLLDNSSYDDCIDNYIDELKDIIEMLSRDYPGSEVLEEHILRLEDALKEKENSKDTGEDIGDIINNRLELTKESLELLKSKDFYYIPYMEVIETNNGNGKLIIDFIKQNYLKTVLIPSGYSYQESSKEFWSKQGYKESARLIMFYN